MKKKYIKTLILILLALGVACGVSRNEETGNEFQGGSEVGNPPIPELRDISGFMPLFSLGDSLENAGSCAAEAIVAISSLGENIVGDVGSDCRFTLRLEVGIAYTLRLVRGEAFIASLFFNNGQSRFETPLFFAGNGVGIIDLGRLTFKGFKVIPEKEPSLQTDRNGNGINDFYDEDDDGDGITDENEDDCDLDGIPDDFEDGDCSTNVVNARAVDVTPSNNSHFVNTDEAVESRFNCELDPTAPLEFHIESDDGESVPCAILIRANHLSCEHDDIPFNKRSAYTAFISGARCKDGRQIRPITWFWNTGF